MNDASLDMVGENGEIHASFLISPLWTPVPFMLQEPPLTPLKLGIQR